MAKKPNKTKNKKGRPPKKFTDEQVAEMQKMAFAGCQNNTIATLMDIPINTLIRHFGKLLTKKRCERKYELRKEQDKAAAAGNPALLIFLGKNDLGQADKQETEHSVSQKTAELLGLIDGSSKGKLPDNEEEKDAG